jgi:thiol-disulfide isomerase/thioredoxin
MRRLIILLFAVVAISAIPGCHQPEKINDTERSNSITIIFKDAPQKWKIYKDRNSTAYRPAETTVHYISDNLITRRFSPDSIPTGDTLTIDTKRDIVELEHSYFAMENLSYLFRNGDTVLFTYNNRVPRAEVINRKESDIVTNYELRKREFLYNEMFSALSKSNRWFSFINIDFKKPRDLINDQIKIYTRRMREKARNQYRDEIVFLDSLKNSGVMSETKYLFYKNSARYRIENMNLTEQHEKDPYNSKVDSTINMQYNSENPIIQFDNIQQNMYSSAFRVLTDNYVTTYITSKVSTINSTYSVDGIETGGSTIKDYRELYDTLMVSNLPEDLQKYYLLGTMGNIISNMPASDIRKYYNKFRNDINDSAYIDYIDNKYGLKTIDNGNKKSDLMLFTTNGETVTYNDVVAKNKGKVIYVDFWAHWCSPCLRMLPHADKLKKEYDKKDIVFIYISKDRDMDKWKSACKKHGISENSYMIKNIYTSLQLQDMMIKYIPHYILYNKKGDKISYSAPRPDSKKIRTLLNSLVKK